LFQNKATGAQFWTLSGREKDRLLTVYHELWTCEGVGWYAYVAPDAKPGLLPVYRFWSPAQDKHFYTMSESEKEKVLAESTGGKWISEGAVFYVFGQFSHPADTAAVSRISDPTNGYSWTMHPTQEQKGDVAWYAHPAQNAPAGAGIENAVFRWRPTPDQVGEHQMNIIVTDGESPCCQVVVVRVVEAGAAGQSNEPSGVRMIAGVSSRSIPLRRLAAGVAEFAGGISDDLMIIPVLPWILGLWVHLRTRATRIERVLVLAVLAVGAGLMLGRSIWLVTGSARRYCLPLVAMTIFYLPAGLDIMTRLLNRIYTFRGRLAAFGAERRPPWFYLLMLGGVILCTPKLISTPLRADKSGYQSAARWLQENTPAEALIADPDRRISFYADRAGLIYERYPDWKRADYVIAIGRSEDAPTPQGWSRVYSTPVSAKDERELAVYGRTQARQ